LLALQQAIALKYSLFAAM